MLKIGCENVTKPKLGITTITVKRETKIAFDKKKAEFQGSADEFIIELLKHYENKK